MDSFDSETYVEDNYSLTPQEFSVPTLPVGSDSWLHWQTRFRTRLEALLGISALRDYYKGLDLDPILLEREDYRNYRRETWKIKSERAVDASFHLFLPKTSYVDLPAFIALHGHNSTGKEVFSSRQDVEHELVLSALNEGYAVVAPDLRGFGEMARREDTENGNSNSCEELQRRALMFGRTLIGERVYDVMRIINFLATHGDIDPNRIVINGHSGGAAVALLTTAIDTRITIGIPTSYFCTFKDSIMSIHHCICNTIPGILRLAEMADIAALSVPRPMLFIHGTEDPIFPIEGTRKAYAQLRKSYRSMGAQNRCQLVVGEYGHVIYHEPIWPFLRKFM